MWLCPYHSCEVMALTQLMIESHITAVQLMNSKQRYKKITANLFHHETMVPRRLQDVIVIVFSYMYLTALTLSHFDAVALILEHTLLNIANDLTYNTECTSIVLHTCIAHTSEVITLTLHSEVMLCSTRMYSKKWIYMYMYKIHVCTVYSTLTPTLVSEVTKTSFPPS